MKNHSMTRTIPASLTALALCLAPLSAQRTDRDRDRDTTSGDPTISASGAQQGTTTTGAATSQRDTGTYSDRDNRSQATTTTGDTSTQRSQQGATMSTERSQGQQGATMSAERSRGQQGAAMSSQRMSDLHTEQRVQIAWEDADEQSANKLSGKDVRGSDNEKIGNIKDFIVDAQSGKILYVVISSGGFLGIGDTLRLVPFNAVQRSSADDDRFVINIAKAQWDQLAALEERHYNDGRIVISEQLRTQLTEHFGQADMTVTETTATTQTQTDTAGDAQRMVRASDFRGKEVRAGDREVGDIDAVIIDFNSGTAMALLDPENDFVESDEKFLVPLSQLTFPGRGREPVTTTLSASDFQQAQPATQATYTATGRTTSTDLSPTGRTVTDRDDQTYRSDRTTQQPAATGTTTRTQQDTSAPTGQSRLRTEDSATGTTRAQQESAQQTQRDRRSSAQGSAVDAERYGATSSTATRQQDRTATSTTAGQQDSQYGQSTTVGTTTPARSSTGQDTSSARISDRSTAQQSQSDVATTTSRSDQYPTPTGRTSAQQDPLSSANPTLAAIAMAVRSEIDKDPQLSRHNIEIAPQNDKLVIRGTVPNEQVKRQVERMVEDAVKKPEVENELRVENERR
jgi:sporulation protein YlmC with PRC-barrel domain